MMRALHVLDRWPAPRVEATLVAAACALTLWRAAPPAPEAVPVHVPTVPAAALPAPPPVPAIDPAYVEAATAFELDTVAPNHAHAMRGPTATLREAIGGEHVDASADGYVIEQRHGDFLVVRQPAPELLDLGSHHGLFLAIHTPAGWWVEELGWDGAICGDGNPASFSAIAHGLEQPAGADVAIATSQRVSTSRFEGRDVHSTTHTDVQWTLCRVAPSPACATLTLQRLGEDRASTWAYAGRLDDDGAGVIVRGRTGDGATHARIPIVWPPARL